MKNNVFSKICIIFSIRQMTNFGQSCVAQLLVDVSDETRLVYKNLSLGTREALAADLDAPRVRSDSYRVLPSNRVALMVLFKFPALLRLMSTRYCGVSHWLEVHGPDDSSLH